MALGSPYRGFLYLTVVVTEEAFGIALFGSSRMSTEGPRKVEEDANDEAFVKGGPRAVGLPVVFGNGTYFFFSFSSGGG